MKYTFLWVYSKPTQQHRCSFPFYLLQITYKHTSHSASIKSNRSVFLPISKTNVYRKTTDVKGPLGQELPGLMIKQVLKFIVNSLIGLAIKLYNILSLLMITILLKLLFFLLWYHCSFSTKITIYFFVISHY